MFTRISAQRGCYLNLRGVIKSIYQPLTARGPGSAVILPAGSEAEPQPSTILVNFEQKRSILCSNVEINQITMAMHKLFHSIVEYMGVVTVLVAIIIGIKEDVRQCHRMLARSQVH